MVAMTPSLFPVDLAGVLSKLAPPLGYMRSLHRTIRSRAGRPTQRESAPASAHRSIGSETLDTLERRYHDGEALRAIANDVGISPSDYRRTAKGAHSHGDQSVAISDAGRPRIKRPPHDRSAVRPSERISRGLTWCVACSRA